MNCYERLASDLRDMLQQAYPDIQVRAELWSENPTRTAIYFVESRFALLYPRQRYHYLSHLIPKEFYDRELTNTVWFELAPGESPHELDYPDEAMIEDITPAVMSCVTASGFFEALDEAFCPRVPSESAVQCHGDFRLSKQLLSAHGFKPDEFSDVLHVLMSQGGYCDCEILYNVAEQSRLRSEYWKARASGLEPQDPNAVG
jgi:hypothetical protein